MRLSSRRALRWVLWGLFLFVPLAVIYQLTNVDTRLSDKDIAAFESVGLARAKEALSFEQEVLLIRDTQGVILQKSPLKKGIPKGASREPGDLFKYGYGLCYDRSRALDKAYKYLGFESRHVFMLYRRNDDPFWKVLLSRGRLSHAVTEVKTSRGWLVVDSTSPWVSVDKQGNPLDADHMSLNPARFAGIPEYMARPAWSIRGLYSRHGQFFHAYPVGPELSYVDFFRWWFGLV